MPFSRRSIAVSAVRRCMSGNANGLSLQVAPQCDGTCDARASIPLQVVASQPNTAVHVRVVRSPHVYVGYVPDSIPWATTKWLDTTVRTDAQGRASVVIPRSVGRTCFDVRRRRDERRGNRRDAHRRTDSACDGPPAPGSHRSNARDADYLDAYANDVASAKPLAGITVKAKSCMDRRRKSRR